VCWVAASELRAYSTRAGEVFIYMMLSGDVHFFEAGFIVSHDASLVSEDNIIADLMNPIG
jgi:hypothetical protein